MERGMKIHDFIENYSDQNYEDIQWDIASRKEFNELTLEKKESVPEKGKFFNHQNIFLRYIKQYDRIFNIHETGTGKTGTIINAVEYFRKNDSKIKKVFVLQPGPNTVDDFKNQIVKLSSFDYSNIKDSTSEIGKKNLLTREINKNYEITTYQKFYKDAIYEGEIEKYFSDSIFFLDEAHKLRNLKDKTGGEMGNEQLVKIYNYIWKVVHYAKRIKVVISTATPMLNKVKDLIPLLNLLLPSDFQFPMIKEDVFYENLTIEQVEPYFRGKFTFVKFMDTGVEIIQNGNLLDNYYSEIEIPINSKNNPIKPIHKILNNGEIVCTDKTKKYSLIENQKLNKTKKEKCRSNLKIFLTVMNGIQLETFEQIEKEKKVDGFYINKRQASVFVFPNGSYGQSGFNTYIEKNNYGKYIFKRDVYDGEKKQVSLNQIFDNKDLSKSFKNLFQLSSKFNFFIKKEFERSEKKKPGNSFCYLEKVEGSGVILLGLILERLGFEDFISTNLDILDYNMKIMSGFPKKKRFALLTGNTKNIRNIIDVFNSRDNMYGEYIQILIASEAARDGINLENVVRGYILTPGWHESGMHQAMSRFIRATSHNNLINNEKTILRQQNKRYTDFKIKVDVYRLAAVKSIEDTLSGEEMSIDIKLYLDSENKDIKIKRIMKSMKECSFDAYLTYKRNTSEIDEKLFKEDCYGEKNLKIWNSRGEPGNQMRTGMADNQGPNHSEYIYNTYNIFYSNEIKDMVREHIQRYMNREQISVVNLEKYVKSFLKENNIDTEYSVYDQINKMVENETVIFDSKNLSTYNLNIVGDNIVKQRVKNNIKNKYIPTETDFMFKISGDLLKTSKIEKNTVLKNLYSIFYGKTKEFIIDKYARNQNYEEFKFLIEDSLARELRGDSNKLTKIILDIFKNYIMLTKIPKKWLEVVKKSIGPSEIKTQGRKRAEGSLAGLKDLNLEDIDPGYEDPETYIHFYKESEKTGFGITSILEGKEKTIRILEDGKFRDTDIFENFVYSYMLNKKTDSIMEKFRKVKYYGSYIYRGGEQEETYDRRKEEFFRVIDNSNPRNKGRVCVNNSFNFLQDVLKYIDTEKKHEDLYTGKIRKKEICNLLLQIFREKGLLFISL